MVIFKWPYCHTEYEMTTAHLSFKHCSYAKLVRLDLNARDVRMDEAHLFFYGAAWIALALGLRASS